MSLLQMGLCWTIVLADVHSSDLKRLNPSLLVIEYIVSLLQMGFCWMIVIADVHSSDLKRLNPSLLVIEYIVSLLQMGYVGRSSLQMFTVAT